MRKAKLRKNKRVPRQRAGAGRARPAAPSGPAPGRRRRGRPTRASRASVFRAAHSPADAGQSPGPVAGETGLDVAARVKELLRLAREQGHLTYDDLNEALPHHLISPADLDHVLAKLRTLEVEIIDASEVDRDLAAEARDEQDDDRRDLLDDPVRMYLRQMGKVPLLTREQEVEICKRIEGAEAEARRIIYGFGRHRQGAPGAGGKAAGGAAPRAL